MPVCRKHGGSTKPAAVNAGKDLLDRVGLGAVVQAKVRGSKRRDRERIVVKIGFLVTPGTEAPIIVDAKPPIDTKE
jgi:hypothetical protein